MENNEMKLNPESLEDLAGGVDCGEPHFNGKLCPECKACTLRFWKFQVEGDVVKEVYNCDACGPVVMHLDWDYGY